MRSRKNSDRPKCDWQAQAFKGSIYNWRSDPASRKRISRHGQLQDFETKHHQLIRITLVKHIWKLFQQGLLSLSGYGNKLEAQIEDSRSSDPICQNLDEHNSNAPIAPSVPSTRDRGHDRQVCQHSCEAIELSNRHKTRRFDLPASRPEVSQPEKSVTNEGKKAWNRNCQTNSITKVGV